MFKKFHLLFGTAVLLSLPPVHAQTYTGGWENLGPGVNTEVEWTEVFGGDDYDVAYSLDLTPDNGYIIAGSTQSFGNSRQGYLVKTDLTGTKIWENTYGGSGLDGFSHVRVTDDGGYIAVGGTTSYGNDWQVFLVKTDPSGQVQWTQTFGTEFREYGVFVEQTEDNGFIIAGDTADYGTDTFNLFLIKTDETGNQEWQTFYEGNDLEHVSAVHQEADGGYIIAATDIVVGDDSDILLIKTDSQGKETWKRHLGGLTSEGVNSLESLIDGGYILSGRIYSDSNQSQDLLFMKLNAEGDIDFQKQFGGDQWDEGHSTRQTSEGGFVVAGETSSYGNGSGDLYLLKLTPNGEKEWEAYLGTPNDDRGYDVKQTLDNGYILVGKSRTDENTPGKENVYITKLEGNKTEPVADVYLSRLRVNPLVIGKVGRASRKVRVIGDGTELTQDATVTLTATPSSPGFAVAVEPASVTEQVVPGKPETRFWFTVSVSCADLGEGTVDWTATISAPANDDPTNDTQTATTYVRCRGDRRPRRR